MSIEEIDTLEESLPAEVLHAFDQANDEIADLNLILSNIDSSSAPYINGGDVDSIDGYDFVQEMATLFPQSNVELNTFGDVSFINNHCVELAFNEIIDKIRIIACQKVNNTVELLRPIETFQLRLESNGIVTEEAQFVSMNTDLLGDAENKEKTVLISPNIVLSEYLKIRLKDVSTDLKDIWEGIFNNNEAANQALEDFTIGKINFEKFQHQICDLPHVRIIATETD